MEFSWTPVRQAIRDNVEKVCANYADDYWLEHDRTGEFPDAFYQAMARGAGSASPCRRPTAAPAWASLKRRS